MKEKITAYLNQYGYWFILLITIILSVTSFFYFYHLGLITAYGDAKAHLNIARRITDNLTPGVAQFGGVWLPLLHILMMPTIWSNFMWHSGIAGSLVNMPVYVLAVTFFYKLAKLVTGDVYSTLIGTAALALNVNFLYLQAIPMTEALFVCTLIIAIYYLLLWVRTNQLHFLLFAGTALFLSTINRYEGWPVALAASALVLITALILVGRRKAEGSWIVFSMLAFLGVGLWLVWQTAIFHDPLYFLHSEFSAKAQTLESIKAGTVPTYHSAHYSLLTYYYAVFHVVGPFLLPLTILGIAVMLYRNLRKPNPLKSVLYYAPLLVLCVPGIFLIYALYKGNIPLNVPEIKVPFVPSDYFNIRYALYSLPACCIFPIIISKNIVVKLILTMLVMLNLAFLLPHNEFKIATVADATGSTGSITDSQRNMAALLSWVHTDYDGGYILASAATTDPIIFETGLNMSTFITEGSGKYWDQSIPNPGKFAKWAIIVPGPRDMVTRHVNPDAFKQQFTLVKQASGYNIYKRNW